MYARQFLHRAMSLARGLPCSHAINRHEPRERARYQELPSNEQHLDVWWEAGWWRRWCTSVGSEIGTDDSSGCTVAPHGKPLVSLVCPVDKQGVSLGLVDWWIEGLMEWVPVAGKDCTVGVMIIWTRESVCEQRAATKQRCRCRCRVSLLLGALAHQTPSW